MVSSLTDRAPDRCQRGDISRYPSPVTIRPWLPVRRSGSVNQGTVSGSPTPSTGDNHILLAGEPAWPVFLRELAAFVEPDRAAAPVTAARGAPADLTRREFEILRLAAAGLSNGEIGETLTLSVRTIERHLSNAYLKLGVKGRAGRAAAVADLVRRGVA
jgi:DNA-binding CsgD family transcriptional regulator